MNFPEVGFCRDLARATELVVRAVDRDDGAADTADKQD
jgi:hypothetical protein